MATYRHFAIALYAVLAAIPPMASDSFGGLVVLGIGIVVAPLLLLGVQIAVQERLRGRSEQSSRSRRQRLRFVAVPWLIYGVFVTLLYVPWRPVSVVVEVVPIAYGGAIGGYVLFAVLERVVPG
ncbi:hypothetical protein [Halopiger goleimassiliensis]|uniref:hypothetical protein n=1 Tax=Halopiger goleimassiliensis TaxID=1293048 RepID=UPI000677C569|nr:hypothetical protein [Halopiger goleimassiliensis]